MNFTPAAIAWHNGKLVEREQAAPSIASHSLHLGVGVFDGIMAYCNSDCYYIHRLEAHLDRLRHGSLQMGLKFDWSNTELESGLLELLESIPPNNYYIRPIVYRSGAYLNFSDDMPVDVTILAVTIARDEATPLSCHISKYERVSSKAIPVTWKICGTYVNSYLSRRAAQSEGFNDAIMLDTEGKITEATAANIFFLQSNAVVTPALNANIFPGITRATLLDIAKLTNIEVVERDIIPSELASFEGAFLAATMMELKPVASIENHKYNTCNHPLFKHFLQKFRQITHQKPKSLS